MSFVYLGKTVSHLIALQDLIFVEDVVKHSFPRTCIGHVKGSFRIIYHIRFECFICFGERMM